MPNSQVGRPRIVEPPGEGSIKAVTHQSQVVDPALLAERWRSGAGTLGAPVALALAEAFTVLNLDQG